MHIRGDRNDRLKGQHDANLSDRFVDRFAAEQVEASSYEKLSHVPNLLELSQATNGSSPLRKASASGSGLSAPPRGPWRPFFNGTGWFASWFSGPSIESTTL